MKKVLYGIILLLIIMIAADRALKVYEKIAADREIQARRDAVGSLTAQQLKDYAEAVQFRLQPYTVFGLRPNFKSDTVNINSLGLRGDEIEEKQKDSYRIVILGGSIVFGGEVANDNLTFCKLLEKNLKNNNENKIEVINAGMPAYISMQELILLEDKLISLKPDLVIVFDGFNDVLTILKREKRPNFPWWFSEIEKIYYTSITKLFIEKKLRKYRPTKFIMKWLDRKKTELIKYSEIPEQIVFYKRNLDLMCHLARSYGINIALVFQPLLLYKNSPTEKEREIIADHDSDYIKVLKEMCDLAKEGMQEIAIKNNVDFIDGTEFFNDLNEHIFIDEVHFNQSGHKIVADLLAERLSASPRIGIKTKHE